jgi:hypothetical protein
MSAPRRFPLDRLDAVLIRVDELQPTMPNEQWQTIRKVVDILTHSRDAQIRNPEIREWIAIGVENQIRHVINNLRRSTTTGRPVRASYRTGDHRRLRLVTEPVEEVDLLFVQARIDTLRTQLPAELWEPLEELCETSTTAHARVLNRKISAFLRTHNVEESQ